MYLQIRTEYGMDCVGKVCFERLGRGWYGRRQLMSDESHIFLTLVLVDSSPSFFVFLFYVLGHIPVHVQQEALHLDLLTEMYGTQHHFVILLLVCGSFEAFQPFPGSRRATAPHTDIAPSISSAAAAAAATTTTLWESSGNPKEEEVELGSTEYIQGMLNRPVDADGAERVSGDKVLGPTLRLAGGVTGVLVAFVLAFLLSNGIISF